MPLGVRLADGAGYFLKKMIFLLTGYEVGFKMNGVLFGIE